MTGKLKLEGDLMLASRDDQLLPDPERRLTSTDQRRTCRWQPKRRPLRSTTGAERSRAGLRADSASRSATPPSPWSSPRTRRTSGSGSTASPSRRSVPPRTSGTRRRSSPGRSSRRPPRSASTASSRSPSSGPTRRGLTFPIVNEELFWGDAGIGMSIFGTTLAVAGIYGSGTPEQMVEWVPQCFGDRRTTSRSPRSAPRSPTPAPTSRATAPPPSTTRPRTSG